MFIRRFDDQVPSSIFRLFSRPNAVWNLWCNNAGEMNNIKGKFVQKINTWKIYCLLHIPNYCLCSYLCRLWAIMLRVFAFFCRLWAIMLLVFSFVDLNLDSVRFLKGRYIATVTQFVHLLCNNFKFKLWFWYKIVFHLYDRTKLLLWYNFE
jgi:hypothetical protein